MLLVRTFAIAIAAIFMIEVVSSAIDNLYTSRKSWRSLQKVRAEIDSDIDTLTASKKRHPAGKKR